MQESCVFQALAGPVLRPPSFIFCRKSLTAPSKTPFFPAARPPSQAVCSSPALTGPDFSLFTAPLKFTVFSARYRSCITFSSRSTIKYQELIAAYDIRVLDYFSAYEAEHGHMRAELQSARDVVHAGRVRVDLQEFEAAHSRFMRMVHLQPKEECCVLRCEQLTDFMTTLRGET